MLSENLKTLLNTSGMTQKELAQFVAVKPNTVSDWLNQGNSPKIEHLCRISELFSVSIDWLLTGKNVAYKKNEDLSAIEIELINDFEKLDMHEKIRVLERAKTLLELKEESKREAEKQQTERHKTGKPPRINMSPAGVVRMQPAANFEFSPELSPDAEKHVTYLKVYDTPASAGTGIHLFEGEATSERLAFEPDIIPCGADFGIRIRGDSMEPRIHDSDIVFVKKQNFLDNGNIGVFIAGDQSYCKIYNTDKGLLESLNPDYPDIKITNNESFRIVGKVLLPHSIFFNSK